jgi:ectoine hydroxylase-related dioxygenase (phytanoyl-CoA dioxygenase family)
MTPEQVLKHPASVLSQEQRESYFETGYLLIERLIPEDVITQLNAVTDDILEKSRGLTASDDEIDLADGHVAEKPLVRRFKKPDGTHVAYWDFAAGVIADVAADLLGPDVRFHHSKLNFKWGGGEDEVKWHQDLPFYPHTNSGVLAIGTYLEDVALEDGPLSVIPGSHRGHFYEHFDHHGVWTGALRDEDVAALNTGGAVYAPGPKGSITVHHSKTVHATKPTTGANQRRLLINSYAAADSFPYTTPKNSYTEHSRELVRGHTATWAHMDPDPCPVPPDWSAGYTSIYSHQKDANADPTPRDPGIRA